jgi:Ca-activated chloride channel family protein
MSTGGFMEDEHGAIRVPKLDPTALAALAQAGGGRYVTLTLDDRDIEALVGAATLAELDTAAGAQSEADQWHEEGPWLLLALLPLAALAFRRGWLSPLLLVLVLAPPPAAEAFSWADLWLRPDQQGVRALEQGHEAQAAETFQRPDWRAAAHYRAGQYEQALADLEPFDGIEVDYNRGNVLARLGQLEDALAAYDEVLSAEPDHADARHNRELVARLLAAQRQAEQAAEGQTGHGPQGQGQPDASAGQGTGEDRTGEDRAAESGQGDRGEGQAAQSSPGEQPGQQPSGDSGQAQGGQSAVAPGAPSPGAGQTSPDQAQADARADASPAQASDPDGAAEAAPLAQTHAPQPTPAPSETEAAGPAPDSAAADPPGPPMHEAARADAATATAAAAPSSASAGAPSAQPLEAGAEPSRGDLLGGDTSGDQHAAGVVEAGDGAGEDHQAMEHLLRRVPDDPAGLLRQRFLLQHLRRNGQL